MVRTELGSPPPGARDAKLGIVVLDWTHDSALVAVCAQLRAKVLKVENTQTEISRIYAKEGSQGGLSDGQRCARLDSLKRCLLCGFSPGPACQCPNLAALAVLP